MKTEIKSHEFELSIDFDLLKKQKSSLIDVINLCENRVCEEALDGILCILDSIQDQAIDKIWI